MNLYLSMDTREARRALKALEKEGKRALKAAMRNALRKGGKQAKGISRRLVPVDSGDLRRSIGVGKPFINSAATRGSVRITAGDEGSIDYSRAVEATDPYLQPAVDRAARDLPARAVEELEREIQKAISRAAKAAKK